ncbi:uncharacterized protein LOC128678792 [Plodia interpunctella]|uniref:uncharacterized protein LOC128678792 n=1 Tax=Plodia interpunctella TaxID=58824 RepID=UPI002367A090|nr:uncharacterized protein LOC128678792 [Plodia interpunctella]
MAGLIFEGETESLAPRQQEFVSGVLQKRGLKADKVTIETLGKAGDNYVANVKKITAKLENGEEFKMIAKIAPTSEMLRATMNTVIMFGNECLMYKEVLPKFRDLQRAAGLSPGDTFRFPECYGASMEPFNEIILLEDLTESNFKMLDRFTPLTNECVKLILKNFAIFHSLSFVLKKQEVDTFDSYINRLGDFFTEMLENDDTKIYFSTVETDTLALMDSDRYRNAVRGTVSKLLEISTKVYKNELTSRYSVITHGDAWTNNVMFRFEENVALEAILIDYQVCKIVSPVNDLQFMILNCTDYGTRRKHYYEWLDYYHTELDNSLANFGLKANYVYPREQLDADLRRHSRLYLAMTIMSQSMLIRKNDDAAQMKEAIENFNSEDMEKMSESMQVSQLDSESVALFKKKIEDMVDSFQDFGYLD